jgi:hypothetical protein
MDWTYLARSAVFVSLVNAQTGCAQHRVPVMPRHSCDDYVRGKCFNDDGLKDFIARNAKSKECSFCGATAEEPIAAPS